MLLFSLPLLLAVLTKVASAVLTMAFLVLAMLVPVWLAFRAWRAEWACRKRAQQAFGKTRPQDGIREWDVALSIVQDRVTTGTDLGRLWIEGGAIYFVGQRTSFALTKHQVWPTSPVSLTIQPSVPLERSVQIRLADRGFGPWSVQFEVTNGGDREKLVWEAKQCFGAAAPPGIGQFPPSSLGPGYLTRSRLLWHLAPDVLLIPVLAGILLWAVFTDHGGIGQGAARSALGLGWIVGWAFSGPPRIKAKLRALRNWDRVVHRSSDGRVCRSLRGAGRRIGAVDDAQ